MFILPTVVSKLHVRPWCLSTFLPWKETKKSLFGKYTACFLIPNCMFIKVEFPPERKGAPPSKKIVDAAACGLHFRKRCYYLISINKGRHGRAAVAWAAHPLNGDATAKALQQNTNLQSLSLDLKGTSDTDETGTAMAKALQQNTNLQSFTLYLWNTSATDETGTAMAKDLQQNTNLQSYTLDLWRTSATDETGTAIARGLQQDTNLQS